MRKSTGYISLITAMIIFGLNFLSIKYVSYFVQPVTLVFIRFLLGTLLLWGIIKFKQMPVDLAKDRRQFVITALLGIVIYYLFQVNACAYLSGAEMALICATIPVVTVLVERVIFKRQVHWSTYILFLVSMVGVYLVLDVPLNEFLQSEKFLGVLLMMGTVSSWVAYTFKTEKLQKEYSSLVMFYKQSVYATLILAPLSLVDIFPSAINVMGSSDFLAILGNFLFLGFICSALGYYFYLYGMEQIGIKLSSLYMNLIPVVAAVASYYILDEGMSTGKIIGMVVVLSAIIAVNLINGRLEQTVEIEEMKSA